MRHFFSCLMATLVLGAVTLSTALGAELQTVRVGVLQFGTVNWELDVIKTGKLDRKYGVNLEVIPLAGKDSSHVALQGGAVDVIVTDWIWVARQRAEKEDFTFVPYSNAVGSVMVAADQGIESLADMEGRKLGVAGGPVDKTWLLLRAYSQKVLGKDIKDMLEPQFAAPPLLNALALKGDLDGVVNFWHFAARLKAAGMKPLLEMPEVLQGLGIEHAVPLIGWVFRQGWAEKHADAIKGFLQASRDAKQRLAESDTEWERLKPLMKAEDEGIFIALRDAYRAGIPHCLGPEEMEAARTTLTILTELGGKDLVGNVSGWDEGVFWNGFELGACEAKP